MSEYDILLLLKEIWDESDRRPTLPYKDEYAVEQYLEERIAVTRVAGIMMGALQENSDE